MARYSFYAPYVPVAKRRAQAAKTAQKMSKDGKPLQPLNIEGRAIANTFWGKAWCANLESYSDYSNRLPRGRTYARNGSVIHLTIAEGLIEAMVQGSSLYKIKITLSPLDKATWKQIKQECTGKITNLLDLIQGKLPKDLLAVITAKDKGLFPTPRQIKFDCSCPDGASMCKHVAAVLYGVGNRLDSSPEHFFTLRSLDVQELLASAGTQTVDLGAASADFSGDDLADIFGIELEGTVPPPAKAKAAKKTPAKKAVTKKIPVKKTPSKKAQKK